MKRKHIDIIGNNANLSHPWMKTVPAHNFVFHEVNGKTIATIERTYWYDSKQGKVRYTGHNCDNASYNNLYSIYAEIYPGVFTYGGNVTPEAITEKLESTATRIDNFKLDPEVENWVTSAMYL